MALIELLLASAAYAVGGLFMKLSEGASRPWPTIALVALFTGGALLQARAMKFEDLGPSYVFVIGVEAVLTVAISAFYLREQYSAPRIAAILVIVAGLAWLRTT